MSNSLKFQRREVAPEIEINALLTADPVIKPAVQGSEYLEITISDNGIGFPEGLNEKIFELFSRLHSKAEFEGTGLGLSISRRIVENHDGVITASPNKDYGAVFTIVIPQ